VSEAPAPRDLPALADGATLADLREWLEQPTRLAYLDEKQDALQTLDHFVSTFRAKTGNGGMKWTPQRGALLVFLAERLRKDYGWDEATHDSWVQAASCMLAQLPPGLQRTVCLDFTGATFTGGRKKRT